MSNTLADQTKHLSLPSIETFSQIFNCFAAQSAIINRNFSTFFNSTTAQPCSRQPKSFQIFFILLLFNPAAINQIFSWFFNSFAAQPRHRQPKSFLIYQFFCHSTNFFYDLSIIYCSTPTLELHESCRNLLSLLTFELLETLPPLELLESCEKLLKLIEFHLIFHSIPSFSPRYSSSLVSYY